jgi:tRNA(Ile)-lysidine synthase
LLRLVERCLREECGVRRGQRVLVACSGGPDSMALLHALATLRRRVGHELVAHGVDHGLRRDARDELAIAAAQASALGVPFEITTVRVAAGGNLQDRARRARLEALGQAAHRLGAHAIATGHTADDRAETVLLRILRGAGPRGLAVLPPRAPGPPGAQEVALIRPLVRAGRADVLAHLRRHAIPSADDPSNLDPRFLRVRVRRELLPLLVELSPKIADHLCALADMLGVEDEGGDERTGDIGADSEAVGLLSGLGRAQRQAIERGRRLGRRSVRIRVRGGAELEVAFRDGRIVLTPDLHDALSRRQSTEAAAPPPGGSTAGGHGGMLVDSEGKGPPSPRQRTAGQDRRFGPARSPRRGSS